MLILISASLACVAQSRAFAWRATPAVYPGMSVARLGACALRVSGDGGSGDKYPSRTRLGDFLQAIEKEGGFDDHDDPLLFSLAVWACFFSCARGVNGEVRKRRVADNYNNG